MPKQRSLAPAVSGHVEPSQPPLAKAGSQGKPKAATHQQSSSDLNPQGYALMMSDPLKAALYPKPDDSAYSTNVQRMKDVYEVVTTSSGEFAFAVGPALSGGTYAAPTITAGVMTSLGTSVNSQWLTALTNENAQYRTLVYIVEWKPAMSTLAGTGSVFVGSYPNTSGNNASGVPLQGISAFFDDVGATGTSIKPACIIMRPSTASAFVTMANSQAVSFACAVIVGSGLPVGVNVGKLHITRIFELEPLCGTMSALSSVYSPCDMTACCVAANLVGPGVAYNAGEDKPYERLVSAGLSIAKKALGAYVNYSTGGAMALARMFM